MFTERQKRLNKRCPLFQDFWAHPRARLRLESCLEKSTRSTCGRPLRHRAASVDGSLDVSKLWMRLEDTKLEILEGTIAPAQRLVKRRKSSTSPHIVQGLGQVRVTRARVTRMGMTAAIPPKTLLSEGAVVVTGVDVAHQAAAPRLCHPGLGAEKRLLKRCPLFEGVWAHWALQRVVSSHSTACGHHSQ